MELTKEYIAQLEEHLATGQLDSVKEDIATLHPADAAEIIEELDEEIEELEEKKQSSKFEIFGLQEELNLV